MYRQYMVWDLESVYMNDNDLILSGTHCFIGR